MSALSLPVAARQRGLCLSIAVLAATLLALPHAASLFHYFFPELERPLYTQESLANLLLSHLAIVAASSLIAMVLGAGGAILVCRSAWRDLRPLLETLLAISQSLPPVAVLAVAAPLIGFGETPALIALVLYGMLPIAHGTLNGLDSVSPELRDVARGMGMTTAQSLWKVELPLAAPVMLAGIRTSVVINIGTAAIASTVGAKTLGLPIIVGLSGFNTAYVIQGALLVALLAIMVDQAFESLAVGIAAPSLQKS